MAQSERRSSQKTEGDANQVNISLGDRAAISAITVIRKKYKKKCANIWYPLSRKPKEVLYTRRIQYVISEEDMNVGGQISDTFKDSSSPAVKIIMEKILIYK